MRSRGRSPQTRWPGPDDTTLIHYAVLNPLSERQPGSRIYMKFNPRIGVFSSIKKSTRVWTFKKDGQNKSGGNRSPRRGDGGQLTGQIFSVLHVLWNLEKTVVENKIGDNATPPHVVASTTSLVLHLFGAFGGTESWTNPRHEYVTASVSKDIFTSCTAGRTRVVRYTRGSRKHPPLD